MISTIKQNSENIIYFLILCLLPDSGWANEKNSEHLHVTAQRQPYLGTIPLKQLPQAVQPLPSSLLRDAGIHTLQGALDYAAGISRQNNFGGLFDSYAIRGFAGNDSQSSNYLLNGFNASRGYGGARDASNIERIDVVKGPTSSLFGRGDPGGVVNIVTKKPFFRNAGYLEGSGGSFGARRVEGDINGMLTSKAALRVTGAYDEGDSFRSFVFHKRYTLTPSFVWKLTPKTSFTYELEYLNQEILFDRGIVALKENVRTLPRSRFLGEPADGPIHTATLSHQWQLQHNFSNEWSILAGAGYRTSYMKGFSTEAENTTSRQKLLSDGVMLSRQRRYRDYNTGDLTLRTELSGILHILGRMHHFQLGGDWDEFNVTSLQNRFRPSIISQQTSIEAGNTINIFHPHYGNQPYPSVKITDSFERNRDGGIYGQDMVHLTRRVYMRLGGRFDYFEQKIFDHVTSSTTSQKKYVLNPQVGISYLPTRSITLYASYGQGFRPNTGYNVRRQPFAPERTHAWEIGSKLSALQGDLTATLALYTMIKTNILTADPVNANYSLAVGKARSRGFELFVSGKLPYKMRVNVNYSYTDAFSLTNTYDSNDGYVIRRGDPLINVAKHSASILVFKNYRIYSHSALIGVGCQFVGKRLGETGYRNQQGQRFMLPSYMLVNVMGGIDVMSKVRLSGEITNLFNVHYFPSSYSRLWLMPGASRQFMLHLRKEF